MEAQLKSTLDQAIKEFDHKRTAILKLAFDKDGQAGVQKAEEKYDALRNVYFEILRSQLDQGNFLYESLTTAANEETEKLRNSVKALNNINDLIELTTAVVTLVEKVIQVLAI